MHQQNGMNTLADLKAESNSSSLMRDSRVGLGATKVLIGTALVPH